MGDGVALSIFTVGGTIRRECSIIVSTLNGRLHACPTYSIESLSTRVLLFVAALTRNQNPCPAPVRFFFLAMVAVESVLSDVYMSDAPESMPVSDADVDARNWSEYFAGVDDETLLMGGHETVIDSSSASTRMIPSLFIVQCCEGGLN